MTGFTPFGGETVNPALEAVKRVRCPEAELRILEVPTVFGDSARLVTTEMDAFRPDVVLCVGQAAGRSAVTPERVAINVDDARIPDNAGQQPVDAPIVPGGPAAYFATVPVKDMVRAIREAGVPSELSNSAGTYVCNHLLYCVLHHAGPGVRELCCRIASAVQQAVSIPVIVKLTPQVDSVAALVQALYAAGIRAVTVMHRYQGLMVDPETDAPVLGGWAALGGPWMKPISLANIARVRRAAPEVTIVGGNGADTARDIYDFISCGARLVEVGSSMMLRGPAYARQLVEDFEALLRRKGTDADALVGRTADGIVTYQNLGSLPRRQVEVQTELCAGCQGTPCVTTCYFGGMTRENGQPVHHPEACSGCGLCAHSCGRGAVRIRESNE